MLFIKIYGGISIKIIICIFLFILFFYETYHELTIFQQSSYKVKEYLKHFRKYYFFSISSFLRLQVVMLGILYYWYNHWFLGFILLFLALGCINLKEKKIINLKITKRITRLFLTIGLYLFVSSMFSRYLLLVNVYIVPFIIILCNYINYPIEVLINCFYIKKAKRKIEKCNIIKIGITGSYGKTSCKYFLSNILSSKYLVHKSPKSYNTMLGLTKDVLNNLKEYDEIYIAEMGATKPKDIEKINQIINVDIGIITSIGTQHLDSFKSIDKIIETKLEILKSNNIKTLVINSDNEYLQNYKYPSDIKVIKVSMNNKNVDYYAYDIEESFNLIKFKINNVELETNLLGIHNVTNLLLAYAVCKELKLEDDEIQEAFKNIEAVEHRLSYTKYDNYQVIDDSFNSNFEGFKNAIRALSLCNTRKILITPGLVDQKEKLQEYYQELCYMIMHNIDYVYLIKNENINVLIGYFESNNFNKYNVVDSFQKAFEQAKNQNVFTTILIENDLTDYYLSRG